MRAEIIGFFIIKQVKNNSRSSKKHSTRSRVFPTLLSCSTASCVLYNRTEHNGGFFINIINLMCKACSVFTECLCFFLLCSNRADKPSETKIPFSFCSVTDERKLLLATVRFPIVHTRTKPCRISQVS